MAERSVVVRFRAIYGDLQRGTKAASSTLRDFSRESDAAARKHKTEWDQVGRQTAVAGVAVAAGLGVAVKKFADFDQAMSAAAAGTNATVNELGRLREAAIQAGADTQYSATEAAQAITEMGKAGVSTQAILGGGLRGALNLAAAGQMDVARASEIAATALTQYNLQGAQLTHVADLYAAAAGKAQGSVEDIGQAMKYAGVTANSMGISIEETTGTIGLFASKGIIGEQAGTTFRSMLLSLTSPSKIAKGAMDDLGISMYDASGKFVGVEGAAEELRRKLGPLDEATRNQALGQIFGNESMNGAIALYEGGAAAVQDWTKKVDDAGFAARQAAKLTDNWKGDVERLGGSLDTVFIKSGSSANGVLRALTQGAEDSVNAFGELPGPLQATGVGVAAVTAAALILGGTTLAMVPKIAAGKAALVELGVVSEATAAKGMTSAGKAAKGLAGAMAVLSAGAAASNLADDPALKSWGLETLTKDLLGSQDALAVLNHRLEQSATAPDRADAAVRSFGDALHTALDPSFMAQADNTLGAVFGMLGGTNHSNIKVAADRLQEIDAALVQLQSAGHGPEAARIFSQLSVAGARAGYTMAELESALPGYTEALAANANQADLAGTAQDKVAAAAKKTATNMPVAEGATASTASAMLLLGTNATLAKDQVEELAKTIQSDMDAASSAFARDMDVLGKYDPEAAAQKAEAAAQKVTDAEKAELDTRERVAAKKKRTISDTQALEKAATKVDEARAEALAANAAKGAAGLEASYKTTLANARAFTRDIGEVTKRGLSPNTVAKLLQEGPEKAAPALEALLGTNSANLITMSNRAEAALRTINASVVEQSRLTSMALNSTTDTMTADLDTAMAISAAKAAFGGKATADAIARQLHIGVEEVKRIAGEYGIAFNTLPPPKPIPVTANSAQARATLADIRQQLANMDGTVVHTYIETKRANDADARQDRANSRGARQNLLAWDGSPQDPIHRAAGGPIVGPGTSTSDSIRVMASLNEHMWSAAEVAGAGGHGAVAGLRALALSGRLSAQRMGGGAGSSVSTHTETNNAPIHHYGDIVTPDPNGYRAAMEADQRYQALREH